MIDVDAIRPGDVLPQWEREGTLHHWNRFASVNYEYADHHMDDEAGKEEGFPGAFMMAPLQLAYVNAMLRQWIGTQGRIVRVGMKFRSPFLRGRRLIVMGQVTAVRPDGDGLFVDLDLVQQDDSGTMISPTTATVLFPRT
jgi:acyl dehydratase